VFGRELRLGGVELGQDAVRARDEAVRGGGEPDVAAVALEQRHPGLLLEPRQRLRDRRRRVADRLRDLRDRPAPGQLTQQAEAAHVEHR
jgi:hypothetical protein